MADTHRTIRNRGACERDKYVNAEAITPGMLVTLNSSGNLIKHNVAEVITEVMIADENALYGRTVDTNWSSGDLTSVLLPAKGSVINVLVASGQTITIGEYLCSAGNGLFSESEAAASGSTPTGALVKAIEASSGALTANTLIACRVL